MKYTQNQIKSLLDGIYDGSITEYDLPQDLYLAIADYLKKGLYEGFGNTLSKLSENLANGNGSLNDLELLAELRSNIYMFSAAKTFQQVKEMTSALVNEDGVVRSFSAFKKEAINIFGLYNETWLKTEYNTAIGQAQEAIKWQRIEEQKDVLPYLKYQAVLDPHTSIICRPLDGIVAKVGDPIWAKIAPLNHFNCRCLLLQVDEEEGRKELTPDGDKLKRVDQVEAEMQPVFKMNAGKDGYIFKGDHPYFEVAKKDREYAKNNFDLPIPKNDKK
jgi:SPP1 gp7 family putative phage head morphogenesis protein